MESARCLFVSAMFPLTSLSYMLLSWQTDEPEDTALTDSDEDEDHNDGGDPKVRYATHEDYQR